MAVIVVSTPSASTQEVLQLPAQLDPDTISALETAEQSAAQINHLAEGLLAETVSAAARAICYEIAALREELRERT